MDYRPAPAPAIVENALIEAPFEVAVLGHPAREVRDVVREIAAEVRPPRRSDIRRRAKQARRDARERKRASRRSARQGDDSSTLELTNTGGNSERLHELSFDEVMGFTNRISRIDSTEGNAVS